MYNKGVPTETSKIPAKIHTQQVKKEGLVLYKTFSIISHTLIIYLLVFSISISLGRIRFNTIDATNTTATTLAENTI